MTIKAWLEGDGFTLHTLAELFSDGDIRVVRERDRFYLSSHKIDSPEEGQQFYDIARELLLYVNGIGRVSEPRCRPVRLTGEYGDGDRQHVVVEASTATAHAWLSASAIVVSVDGVEVPGPPAPGPRYAKLALSHPDVQVVLRMLARPEELGWGELYKVYELIKNKVPQDIRAKDGRFSNTMIRRFKGSANHPGDAGEFLDEVRHAVPTGEDGVKRMSLPAGRRFIGDWVGLWLDHLDEVAIHVEA
ncbi:hypothetical protein ACWDXV_25710 [Nocardia nova]